MADGTAKAYNINVSRALDERIQENQPFIYADEFNKSIRMAFVWNLQINIRDGTKDLAPMNLERVRVLDDHPGVDLVNAPRQFQIDGQPPLIQSITGYKDKRGNPLHSVPYHPNQDTRVETKHARTFRAVVTSDQLNLTAATYQQKYTYISLELGNLVVCTQTEDGYHQTYWRRHVTLAYLAATEAPWKARMFGLMDEKMQHFSSTARAA